MRVVQQPHKPIGTTDAPWPARPCEADQVLVVLFVCLSPALVGGLHDFEGYILIAVVTHLWSNARAMSINDLGKKRIARQA